MCLKSIKQAKQVADYILKAGDKAEYIQAFLNMELSAASKYTKLFFMNKQENIDNHKGALECYERARTFAKEF